MIYRPYFVSQAINEQEICLLGEAGSLLTELRKKNCED